MTPRKPGPDYRGAWNHARFIAECKAKDITNGTELAKTMREWLAAHGVPPDMRPSLRTWQRLWNGETDPTTAGGPKGSRSMLLDLADFFGVSPAWLLCFGETEGRRAALIAKMKGGAS